MRRLALAVTLFVVTCGIATADTYPSRRITVIVPFGAGSGTDSVARIVTQPLAEKLKATIVVENRAGASGAIGAVAARSAPDGYTLFFGGSSTQAANPSLLKSIQYDPKTDFAPIARLGLFPYIVVVHPDVQAKTIGELVALAKQKPGTLSFAYGNALGQLSGEMFKRRTGVDVQAIPYKSTPEAVTDLLAGRVSMMFTDMTPVLSLIRSGQLRAVATITPERSPLLSDLPSIQEQGLDYRSLSAWTGMFAPKDTPADVIARLTELLREIVADPAIKQRLAEIGFEARYIPPKEFADFVAGDIELWAAATKEAGIERQ